MRKDWNPIKKSIYDPIKQNKMTLFSQKPQSSQTKTRQKVQNLKSDRNLFSSLFISSLTRHECNLDDFLTHENHPYPITIRLWTVEDFEKSDRLICLNKFVDFSSLQPQPVRNFDAVVIDGSMFVNSHIPKG